MSEKLIALFKKMSEHTAPVCAKMYCSMAMELAAEQGIVLERTNHPRLPLMGADGCTAPPHLRPLCTLHVCCIGSFGFKPNDPGWTREYFRIRRAIDRESSVDKKHETA